MNSSVSAISRYTRRRFFIPRLICISIVCLLCYTSTQTSPSPQPAVPPLLDSAEMELSVKSRDILNFITGVDSLPEYLQADLHIRILCSILASMDSRFSKVSRTVTVEDSIKYVELLDRLIEFSTLKKDVLEYKHSSAYVEDIIDHLYLTSTPYNYKIKGDKVRSIKKMLIAYKYFSRKEVKKLSRTELKLKIAKFFEKYQFGKYKPDPYPKPVYERVLVMNKIYGNPKIDFSYQFDSTMSYGRRAYYISADNTMYLGIHPHRPLYYYSNDWVAELSHVSQYYKLYSRETMTQRNLSESMYIDSVSCQEQMSTSNVVENQESVSNNMSIKDVREGMYEKQEKINGFYAKEYEAHKIIEPQLIQEYRNVKRNVYQ